MFHSRGFLSKADKVVRAHRDDPGAAARALEDLFAERARVLPEDMARVLAAHCVATRDTDDERMQALADMIDLVHQQYDETADPFTPSDWQVLRDAVDEFAGDLDMDLVQYVMEYVVSHKAL